MGSSSIQDWSIEFKKDKSVTMTRENRVGDIVEMKFKSFAIFLRYITMVIDNKKSNQT